MLNLSKLSETGFMSTDKKRLYFKTAVKGKGESQALRQTHKNTTVFLHAFCNGRREKVILCTEMFLKLL